MNNLKEHVMLNKMNCITYLKKWISSTIIITKVAFLLIFL